MGLMKTIFGEAAPAGTYDNSLAPAPVAGAPPTPTPTAVVAATGAPGNIPAPVDPNAPPAPAAVVPVVAAPKEPDSPLEAWKDLWQTAPIKEGEGPAAPVALTATDIQKVVADTNFTGDVTAEQVTAISAGGEDAVKAMVTMMNTMGRNVMTQATLVSDRLADKRVAAAITTSEAAIPALVRRHSTNADLADKNPLFNNPAVAPIIEATQTQLLQKFPDATPTQITKMTEDYIVAIADSLIPKAPVVNDNGEEGSTNWGAFFDSIPKP